MSADGAGRVGRWIELQVLCGTGWWCLVTVLVVVCHDGCGKCRAQGGCQLTQGATYRRKRRENAKKEDLEGIPSLLRV